VAEHVSAPQARDPRHPSEAPEHHSAAPYVGVWIALLVLTGVTYYTGHAHLEKWALPLALTIATVKSTLVALFFMHLWDQRGPNRLIIVVSAMFVLLLIGITVGDVATRFVLATPRGAPFGARVELAEPDQVGVYTAGSPAGVPSHDGKHPGLSAPSEGSLKSRERKAQDPTRP
jgi:cytochrome c oxidase subunit 4